MKVTIQRPTAAGVGFITLPDNILEVMGWKTGDNIYIEPVVNKSGVTTHIVLEKR